MRLLRLCAGVLAAVLPALAAAQPAAPPAPLIPVERFAQIPSLTNPLLSPDGRRIAARMVRGDAAAIGIWQLNPEGASLVTTLNASSVQSFEWAGDGRLLLNLILVRQISGYGIMIPVRRAAVHDLASNRATALCPGGGGFSDEIIFVDPAGGYALLSSHESLNTGPHVQRADLSTGQCVEVQPIRHGIDSWYVDSSGVVRMGVDYSQRRMRIYYRPASEADLRLIETRRPIQDESVIDLVRFVSNTNRGIILTNAETGRFGVYDYDFATDTRGAALFEHPEVDAASAIFAADGTLDGVRYEDDRPRVRWLRPELEQMQRTLDRTFPGKTNQVVNRSRDGNRVLILSSAADDPGTYYIYDRIGRRMETFASPYDSLQGVPFAPVRPVSYQSRDGLRINGYLTLPRGGTGRALPLIMLPHGGPFARDSWTFDPQVQFLASRGYAVLQPNFRGSTGYGRAFVERGYGQLGTGMIDDIEDGVRWLVREGVADEARVCIMGSSYGGYAALWAPIRSPNRYRCAISMAGISDMRAMLRYDSRLFAATRYSRAWRRRVQGEERTDLSTISPLQHSSRLRVPLLIAHGEGDTNVPPSQSRDLVRALGRGNATVESVFYPKAGHGFSSPQEALDFLRRVETFLARHNPPGPVPAAAAQAPAGVPISQASR